MKKPKNSTCSESRVSSPHPGPSRGKRVSSPQPGPSRQKSYDDSDSEDDNNQWDAHSLALNRRLAEKFNVEKQYNLIIQSHIPRADSTQLHECSSCYSSDSDESMSIDGFEPEEERILRRCQVNLDDFVNHHRFSNDTDNQIESDDLGML